MKLVRMAKSAQKYLMMVLLFGAIHKGSKSLLVVGKKKTPNLLFVPMGTTLRPKVELIR